MCSLCVRCVVNRVTTRAYIRSSLDIISSHRIPFCMRFIRFARCRFLCSAPLFLHRIWSTKARKRDDDDLTQMKKSTRTKTHNGTKCNEWILLKQKSEGRRKNKIKIKRRRKRKMKHRSVQSVWLVRCISKIGRFVRRNWYMNHAHTFELDVNF